MNVEKLKEVIKHREYVDEISQSEWDEEIEKCQKLVTEILAEDITSTIEYLNNNCMANEYVYISEVIDDVVDKVPSREFLEAFKKLKDKFPKEFSEYNIVGSIQCAENILKWEEEHGKKD
ncbi:MAG: hypothetical protein IJ195_06020 [Lachnospiraceae bacterium]|nr:hypothetical protein [Lachnospiraceae bacterium]